MSIKFECTCGQRIKANEESKGRWVRCPRCRIKVAVPDGEDPNGSLCLTGGGLESEVQAALEWEERRGKRRKRPAARQELTRTEEWLMEHGIWAPLGIAGMALFAVVGVFAYRAQLMTLVQFSAFMFLIGLAGFLYGAFELKQVVGLKDEKEEKDRPEGNAAL